MLLVSHKFQNIYMHIYMYLCCKSRILVPDDGPQVPKHVAFTDDSRRLLCFTVTNMPVLCLCVYNIYIYSTIKRNL